MLFSLWQADSVPNDHFRCYLFVNAVWQILFPNSRKTRKGCVWDMNKRVRTAQESSFFLLVKYNSTHSVMGRYQGRKRKAWYLNMRKPVLIKLLNWRNHWKRKSRYADYRYQVTELLDPPTPMPAPINHFFLSEKHRMTRLSAFWGKASAHSWKMLQMRTSLLMIEGCISALVFITPSI